ncbi:MAG: glycosyltransferase family 39 protein [Candidatus Magasanikbacteria bacterium]
MNWIKNKNYLLLAFLSIVFFFIYNFLNFNNNFIFNSPDENANFVFVNNFLENNNLFLQPIKDFGKQSFFVHPRSTFVNENKQVLPISFWGIMLVYGLLGKIFSVYAVKFFTSVFVIMAMWAFYFIVEKLFEKRIALLSAFLFVTNYSVWYYSSRSMFHNMPFVSLVIIGVWFLFVRPVKSRLWLNDFLGMFIFLLGVLFRTNEVVWLAIAYLIFLLVFKKNIAWSRFFSWCLVGLFFLLFYFGFSKYLYNGFFSNYISSGSLPIRHWYFFVLPLGFDFWITAKSVWFYFFKINLLYSLSALFSSFLFVYLFTKTKINKMQFVYFLVLLFVSSFLFFYYGSNRDALFSLNTITVAYVRYWLPVFVGFVPIIAFALIFIFDKIKNIHLKYGFIFFYLAVHLFFSFYLVYYGPDGIFAIKNNFTYIEKVQDWTVDNTSPNAIIITDYEDKYFWPKRSVMVDFFNEDISKTVYELLEKNEEIYYFVNISKDNNQKLLDHLSKSNFNISYFKDFEFHSLYKINLK